MLFDNFERSDKVVVALSKILATRLFDSGLKAAYQLELVVDLIRLMYALHLVLLSHFDEFGENIVSFSTMLRQLIVRISLEHISARNKQLPHDLNKVPM